MACEQPLRAHQQDHDHGAIDKGIAEDAGVMRQRRLKYHAGAADQKARRDGSRHAAKSSDYRGDEGDQHDIGAHPDIRRAGVGRQDQPDRGCQHAADGKGQQNDAVGAHPEHAGHGEVLGSRAHLQTVARAFQEQRKCHQHGHSDCDRHDL
jgi:hypothetical protein